MSQSVARTEEACLTQVQSIFAGREEALADEAMLCLFRLRHLLTVRNANLMACRVDEIMSDLEGFARRSANSGDFV